MQRLLIMVCCLLGAWLCAGQVTGQVPGTGSGQTVAGKKPAILIIDDSYGHRDYWNPLTFQEMLDAGYEVGMCPRGKAPTYEELKRYNIALVVSTGKDFAAELQPKLEKFMAEGGGVMVTPFYRHRLGNSERVAIPVAEETRRHGLPAWSG